MSADTTTNVINIIVPVIAMIIGSVLTIIFTPIKKWFYSTKEYECDYRTPTIYKVESHPIIVTKKFGKTKHINCVWFRRKETESRKHNGKKYFYCHFGEPLDPKNNDRELKKCPFV